MDFTAPITYNGWTAALTSAAGAPASGYVVDEVQMSRVDAVGYVEKRALQDGLDAADVFMAGRNALLVVTAFGSTQGDFWDKAQDLLAAFSPTLAYNADSANAGFLAFDFRQPTADVSTWTAGYIPMRYYFRPTSPPQYTARRDALGGAAGAGASVQFTIPLIARDPRKYLQTAVSVSASTATQAITYRGDYPSFPIFSTTLTAAGSSALTVIVDGYSTVINLSGQTTGTFELDYSRRTLTKSGTSYAQLITTSDGYPQVRSGSVVQRLNSTGTSASTFTYREAFA